MNIEGKIVKIFDTIEVGSKGFKKRDLVVKTDEKYPQEILVTFTQDKTKALNSFKAGDHVMVDINLRGRSWENKEGETKWFNEIQGWRISKAQVSGSDQQPDREPVEEEDDLPF